MSFLAILYFKLFILSGIWAAVLSIHFASYGYSINKKTLLIAFGPILTLVGIPLAYWFLFAW